MQSRNGGFGAFDADNTFRYLNEIPFADHGALLDPPTSDVSGRCAARARPAGRGPRPGRPCHALAVPAPGAGGAGPWFGRWGTNYIYGTWSVLTALAHHATGPRMRRGSRARRRGSRSAQNADGGWGEGCESYWDAGPVPRVSPSTACQTAWALSRVSWTAGEVDAPEVRRGIAYLLRGQQPDGVWDDPWFNAPGFPRVFFLKYHGYAQVLPAVGPRALPQLSRAPAIGVTARGASDAGRADGIVSGVRFACRGVVCGVARRAALLLHAAVLRRRNAHREPVRTCTGGWHRRSRRSARRRVAHRRGASALVSWGFAAGLDPALAPGTLVIGQQIEPRCRPARPAPPRPPQYGPSGSRTRLRDRVPLVAGTIACPDHVVRTASEKRALGASGAVAADMETAAIAAAAAAAGIPWLALRVLVDTVRRDRARERRRRDRCRGRFADGRLSPRADPPSDGSRPRLPALASAYRRAMRTLAMRWPGARMNGSASRAARCRQRGDAR